jgi:hypothetical protein
MAFNGGHYPVFAGVRLEGLYGSTDTAVKLGWTKPARLSTGNLKPTFSLPVSLEDVLAVAATEV